MAYLGPCYTSMSSSFAIIVNRSLLLTTFAITFAITFFFFFFNWDSPHARLNSHYEAWNYKKKAQKRLQDTENLFRKNLQLKDVC